MTPWRGPLCSCSGPRPGRWHENLVEELAPESCPRTFLCPPFAQCLRVSQVLRLLLTETPRALRSEITAGPCTLAEALRSQHPGRRVTAHEEPGLLCSPTPRTINTRHPLSCSPHSPFARTLLLPRCCMAGTTGRGREPLAATTPVPAPLAANVNTHPPAPVKIQTLPHRKCVVTVGGRCPFSLSPKHP